MVPPIGIELSSLSPTRKPLPLLYGNRKFTAIRMCLQRPAVVLQTFRQMEHAAEPFCSSGRGSISTCFRESTAEPAYLRAPKLQWQVRLSLRGRACRKLSVIFARS